MKKLMKALAAIMLTVAVVVAAGCQKDPENGGGNNNGGNGSGNGSGGGNNGGGNSGGGTSEGVYLGVIGFNDDLKTKTIGLLNTSSESYYTNFISSLNMRDGTVLYHAVNKSLDWLQSATLPSQLFNVSLVTFTDGLDNGSTMLNNSYNSPSDYLNAVSDRIRNDRVGGKAITAYSIGLRGNDVTDYAGFQQNLQKLSSSGNNYEVGNWAAVKERFRQIAIQLYNETAIVNAEVKIPGGKADGTVIRITFDNVSNANASSQYIQGTYYRENGKGKLKNVIYQGLQSSSGAEVVSDRQDGIFYWYSFAELKLPNGNPFANTSNMNMWYNLANSDWQPESEFTPEAYSDINVNRKSAVAVLVLDCSSSLGSDFNNMKEAAIEFVQLLNDYGNSDNGGGNGGGVDTQTYTIATSANPADGGTVTGGGTYNEGVPVTLRANANTNYTFDHWQDGSTSNPRTITVTASATYTAYFTYGGGGSGNGNANGHAYVDLGLPSGTLWATCNVGATTPEGYGNYYAWGETTTKSTYNWSTYRYCNGSSTTLTKYCSSSTYGNNGFTDNLTTLQLSDDAARANWGGDWRMPTKAEWEELKNNTTVTWTTQNGVYGRKFTASNGNSLFLPAAGCRNDGSLYYAGSSGYYWSSSLDTDNPSYAWGLTFSSGYCYMDYYSRYCGQSVRAVLSASKN
jgi:uncharacterized protein (TIGR02145 family)